MPSIVALQSPKTPENVGSILRLAMCWDVSLVVIIGRQRFKQRQLRNPLNTTQADKFIPVMSYDSMAEFADAMTSQWTPVAVELSPTAESLPAFTHPRSALYLFGPEDGNLRPSPLVPRHSVQIPTKMCLNLAHAVGVTLYDRACKQTKES